MASTAYGGATMEFLGTGKGMNAMWSTNGGDDFKTTFAGELGVRLKDNGKQDFFGYCTSIDVFMQKDGPWGVTKLTTDSLKPNGNLVGGVVNSFADKVRMSGSDADAAAMQLVVWELVNEKSGTFDITKGTFRAKNEEGKQFGSDVLNAAKKYLSEGGKSTALWYVADRDKHDKPLSQDIVAPVPEPMSIGALAIGLAGVLARRRKANR